VAPPANGVRQLREKTSVKDGIEACGVPHPEIDLIPVGNQPVNFSHRLQKEALIHVYPAPAPAGLFPETRLQHRERTFLSRTVTSGNWRATCDC
jgi:hypothetical protein